MTTKPTKPARWADDGVSVPGRVEPSEGKKDSGFANGEKPSAGEHNYQLGHQADWIQYLAQHVEATLLTLDIPWYLGIAAPPWLWLVHGHAPGQPRRWVAFGFGGNVRTTENQRNWTARAFDAAFAGTIQEAIYAADIGEYAFCGSGNFQHSVDGITWVNEVLPGGSTIRGMYRGGGQYVLFGNSGRVLTSPDGVAGNWTDQVTGAADNFRGGCYAAALNLHVVVGQNGAIYTSSDLITWTQRTPDASYAGEFSRVRWNPVAGLLIAVSHINPDEEIQTSPDGINWTRRVTGTTQFAPGFRFTICQGIPIMLALDPDDPAVGGMAYSSDGGITWQFAEHTWHNPGLQSDLATSVDETYIGMFCDFAPGDLEYAGFSHRLGLQT